jgi:hypothetical protein
MKAWIAMLLACVGCGGAAFGLDSLDSGQQETGSKASPPGGDGGDDASDAGPAADTTDAQADVAAVDVAQVRDAGAGVTADAAGVPETGQAGAETGPACTVLAGGPLPCGAATSATWPASFAETRGGSSACDGTYATPSQCQCAQTYTCACVLAGTSYSNQFGSFTACGLASNGPPACSGGGDQPITLECP